MTPLLFAMVDAVLERYKTLIWKRPPLRDTHADWEKFRRESDEGDAMLGWWRSTW